VATSRLPSARSSGHVCPLSLKQPTAERPTKLDLSRGSAPQTLGTPKRTQTTDPLAGGLTFDEMLSILFKRVGSGPQQYLPEEDEEQERNAHYREQANVPRRITR